MYIFKGTDNVGTYAFLNEVVSIADLVAYRNVLIINLVSSRKQPCTVVETFRIFCFVTYQSEAVLGGGGHRGHVPPPPPLRSSNYIFMLHNRTV